MANLIHVVESYLVSQGYHYEREGDRFRYGLRGNNLSSISVLILVYSEGYVCYASAPINAPEKQRMQVSEYLTRANYGLKYCTLEMDFADGELRARSSAYCGESDPPMDAVESIIDMPADLLDKYIAGINAVLYGNVSPQTAVDQVEGNSH